MATQQKATLKEYRQSLEIRMCHHAEFLMSLIDLPQHIAEMKITHSSRKELNLLLSVIHAILNGLIPMVDDSKHHQLLEPALATLIDPPQHKDLAPGVENLDKWLQSEKKKQVDFLLPLIPVYPDLFFWMFHLPKV